MPNPFKSVWLVVVLVAAGAVVLLMSFGQKQEQPQGVVLQEAFHQNTAAQQGQVPAKPADPVPSPAIVSPGGSEPPDCANEYGPVPPLAERPWL